MTKIKICGLTRKEDLKAVVELGADYAGIIFVAASPRFVSPQRASELLEGLDRRNTLLVAVFQDPSRQEVEEVLRKNVFDLLQFHGKETPEFCGSFSLPYIKTFMMQEKEKIKNYPTPYILMDSSSGSQRGGTGILLNWQEIQRMDFKGKKVFLAGGIAPENIGRLLNLFRPYAVDVSSGVEDAPGKKNRRKMEELILKIQALKKEETE